MVAIPLAIVLGVVGLFKDESRKSAIAALVIAGISIAIWIVPLLLFCSQE